MLLKSYNRTIFRHDCNPGFEKVHCKANLDQDISEVLPYLNAELGGSAFVDDPPALTLSLHGKLITLHAKEIWINALEDSDEADRILEWLKQEINVTWENRKNIKPLFKIPPSPRIFDVMKYLPRTNCGKCGLATCTVFAHQLCQGGCDPEKCVELIGDSLTGLQEYLAAFKRTQAWSWEI